MDCMIDVGPVIWGMIEGDNIRINLIAHRSAYFVQLYLPKELNLNLERNTRKPLIPYHIGQTLKG